MKEIFIVEYESFDMSGENPEKVKQDIKVFSGEKSLFDFLATVVDSKKEAVESKITRVTKYINGGIIQRHNLSFVEGNIQLTPKGEAIIDEEIKIEGELDA